MKLIFVFLGIKNLFAGLIYPLTQNLTTIIFQMQKDCLNSNDSNQKFYGYDRRKILGSIYGTLHEANQKYTITDYCANDILHPDNLKKQKIRKIIPSDINKNKMKKYITYFKSEEQASCFLRTAEGYYPGLTLMTTNNLLFPNKSNNVEVLKIQRLLHLRTIIKKLERDVYESAVICIFTLFLKISCEKKEKNGIFLEELYFYNKKFGDVNIKLKKFINRHDKIYNFLQEKKFLKQEEIENVLKLKNLVPAKKLKDLPFKNSIDDIKKQKLYSNTENINNSKKNNFQSTEIKNNENFKNISSDLTNSTNGSATSENKIIDILLKKNSFDDDITESLSTNPSKPKENMIIDDKNQTKKPVTLFYRFGNFGIG